MRDTNWKIKLHKHLHELKIPHLDWYFQNTPIALGLDELFGMLLWDIEAPKNSQN